LRLLKNSHLAAVLVAYLCGVALLRLRVHSCGCDDLAAFEQPSLLYCQNNLLAAVVPKGNTRFKICMTLNIEP